LQHIGVAQHYQFVLPEEKLFDFNRKQKLDHTRAAFGTHKSNEKSIFWICASSA
jgi:hypothetical protein